MSVLDNIDMKCTGKRVSKSGPLTMHQSFNTDTPAFSEKMEFIVRLHIGARTVVREDDKHAIAAAKKDIRNLIAQELYGDIRCKLNELIAALYEGGNMEPEVGKIIQEIQEVMR